MKFILELQFWKHTLNINTQINKNLPRTFFTKSDDY